ncbi:MAG: AAA family ATPase [Deltaproteobacteria bacterium]|nr:AAA family ATPase [Deltaproteobacteria bacterium]
MKIKEIELNNFRIYKGRNIINLLPQKNKNMVIISGKNGYGKTTFLMSLVWGLYGKLMQKVDKFYADEISRQGNYQSYISASINRLARSEGENKFSVTLTFIDVDLPIEIPTKEIKIIRSFDTFTKKEELKILINGVENEITKKYDYQPFILDFILPIEIAKFFLFDAEKIVSLAEVHPKDQKKGLRKAYSEVLGIKKYEDLRNNLQELLQNLKKESATIEERRELDDLRGKLKNNRNAIKKNDEAIDELNEDNNLLSYNLDQLQHDLLSCGHTISDSEKNEMLRKKKELKNKIAGLKEELKKTYEYIPFGIAGNKVLEVSEQLILEKNYKEKQSKIEYIDLKIEKIIERLNKIREQDSKLAIQVTIQKFYNNNIRKLIKEHLFEEKNTINKNFKLTLNFSDNQKQDFDNLIRELKTTFKESLKRISCDYEQSNQELSYLERRIKKAEANLQDDRIKELRASGKDIEKKRDGNNIEIGKLEADNKRLKDKNITLTKKINRLSDKIQVSDSQKELEKTYKGLITELGYFIIEFQNKKGESLQKNLLGNIKKLLHMDLITDVKVKIINDLVDIILYNKRKEEIKRETLSKGQQQIYVSSLLKSLVDESEINFPVFIDSPMQKFDETHSENIIKNFYPTVSEQVIIFPLLKKELTLSEYDILKPFIAKTFLIENITDDMSRFKEIEINKLMD